MIHDSKEDGPPAVILVVDDNRDVRNLACTILDEAGYRVLEAATGERAIVLFDANPDINLIFTDILMPGIDGFKLADMLRSKRPDIRILYTTAYMGLAREKLGVMHGRILRKPYRPAQLEQLVMECLR